MVWILALILQRAFAFHVAVDPGHGGHDIGAYALHGAHRHKESQIVLSISKKLVEHLKKDDSIKVTWIRQTDEFISLEERAEKVNQSKADLLISLHANWTHDEKVSGLEVYFQNQLPPDEEAYFLASRENQGRKLAESSNEVSSHSDVQAIIEDLLRHTRIQKSARMSEIIVENWPRPLAPKEKRKVIRQAPFYIVSNVKMPAVLVELGYLSNKVEAQRLNSPSFQDQIAQSLSTSIKQFQKFSKANTRDLKKEVIKEAMDKSTQQSLN